MHPVDHGPTSSTLFCWLTTTGTVRVYCSHERLRSASGSGMGPKPVRTLSLFRYSVRWVTFSFNKGLKESTFLDRHSLM